MLIGLVAFVYDSDPLQAKFCHCEDCQRLHGESHPSDPTLRDHYWRKRY